MELLPIQSKIYEVRGERIMFDFNLVLLFDTETKRLKQSVRRNIQRFPNTFMFELTSNEWREVVTNCDHLLSNARFSNVLPFAFTEHGVTMLASILKSERAIKMNIAIVTAFIEMKNKFLIMLNWLRKFMKWSNKITLNSWKFMRHLKT
ncbi:MAG TPA: ORF6N domain-containing protein [Chitinophagaceae bacterium]|nr:ORF6N domain-containing protein [Chitinophagaceae bacterium]